MKTWKEFKESVEKEGVIEYIDWDGYDSINVHFTDNDSKSVFID